MSTRAAYIALVLLACVALSHALIYRSDVDASVKTGRRIPINQIVKPTANGFRAVRQNACKDVDNLSEEDQLVCKNMLRADEFRQQKHDQIKAKLAAMQKAAPVEAEAAATGYMVYGQWDGRTYPDVQWALEITRQKPSFSIGNDYQMVYQTLIPTRPGNASAPTFTAFNPLSRNYYLITDNKDFYSGLMWGITISSDTNSSTSTYPKTTFQFLQPGQTMVGLETVMLNNQEVVLVFYDDGTIAQVDPASGNMKPFSSVTNSSNRQVNSVVYNQNSRDIYLLTQNQIGSPSYGIVTFNYATRQSNEVTMQIPASFDPVNESGFEMVFMPTLQQLLVFFTGNFDQLLFVNPTSGAASFAIDNLAAYSGQDGHLEFTVSTFLEDLDTTANAAVDQVGQQVYFQCSDVDPQTGFATTCLCAHPIPAQVGPWDYMNIALEPMTYGYAGAEFVQVE